MTAFHQIARREEIRKNLSAIAHSLTNPENYFIVDHPSLAVGKSGIALFLAYYSQFTRSKKAQQCSQRYLRDALDRLEQLDDTSIASGFFGVSWTFSNLYHAGFISRGDLAAVRDINDLVELSIEQHYHSRNYDLLYGMIGIGMCVLENPTFPRRSFVLKAIGEKLASISLETDEGRTWQNYFSVERSSPEDIAFDLGLAHGVPSVIAFLCQLYDIGIARRTLRPLILDTTRWLLNQECEFVDRLGNHYSFQNKHVNKRSANWSRVAWCYGDLGVAACLLHVYNSTGDKIYYAKAYDCVARTITRNHEASGLFYNLEHRSVDGGFCHGAAGIALMYHLFARTFKDNRFCASRDYYLRFLFDNIDTRLPLAGHLKYKNDPVDKCIYMTGDAGLLEGVAGVGLCFLSMLEDRTLGWERLFFLQY